MDTNLNEQTIFNEIKGRIFEINHSDEWSNIVLTVGKTNQRTVCLTAKSDVFQNLVEKCPIALNELVQIRFYLVSRESHGRYYTNAYMLSIDKLTNR